MDAQRFSGRLAIVTGGSGGLGRAVVAAFLAEGAHVAAIAHHESSLAPLRLLPGADASLLPLAVDLLDVPAVEQAVLTVREWGGRLDILVNAAGANAGGKPVGASADDEWRTMLDANLLTALHATRAVLPTMVAQGGGRIVNVSSRAARHVGRDAAAYTVAKAGLETFTLAVAEEYREQRITANAVVPSAIATPTMLAHATDQQRLRWVPPESIARVILFLASDEAVDVSGALLPVYGRA
ncbi:MAG TPA: SDR family NAD(P)-dependent oxidoreductase [Chloroflexota bacterium]|nr:SDR family NAD(P)-dependent oxidoreductase [Chloroflexota bacterium]